MASLNSQHHNNRQNSITILIIILLLLHLQLSPVSCFNQHPAIPPTSRDLLNEEKIRLGSIPPTCRNKCNQCHPCMAIQVPTSPSHDHHAQPGTMEEKGFFLQGNNRYSNYKPLSWKCHCGGHLFIP